MEDNAEKIKLLIVDDEMDSRDVLVRLLSAPSRDIWTAKDGLEAKRILTEQSFDLLLTDLNMPGMNGMELLKLVKTGSPQTLVVMITGYATLENTLTAIKEGAYDYITKPFKLAEMDILVRNACEKILLVRERDQLTQQIKAAEGEVSALTQSVQNMQDRIRQLEEREEDLFVGNFDLRIPVDRESVALRYKQGKGLGNPRNLLISRLEEMKKNAEISDDDFHRYLRRLNREETPPAH